MIEITDEKNRRAKRTLGQWLFNPFQFIAGFESLCLGLAIMLLTAYVGSLSRAHFNGVLNFNIDLFNRATAASWVYVAEVLIDWFSISGVLAIVGFFASHSSFRIIDVLGTQALARAPYLLNTIVNYPKVSEDMANIFYGNNLNKERR